MSKFKNYQLPRTYHLGSEGMGCAFEPPNHPRYFVRPIYTQYGNSPNYARPQLMLNGDGYKELEEVDKLFCTQSFPKLPLDHPRVIEWMKNCYQHWQHCWFDESAKDNLVIMSQREIRKMVIEETADERVREIWEDYCDANKDKHKAVLYIRKNYPEHVPNMDWILNPPRGYNWYTRHDEKPTPETCKGESWKAHPVNGSWCQVCGWKEGE